MSDHERCRAITEGGTRCKIQNSLSEDGLCLWHDPERAEEAARARRRGGRNGGRRPKIRTAGADEVPDPPQTIEDVVAWTSWATWAVATGAIDSRTAHEIGYLARALQAGLEKTDLSEEVDELREMVEQLMAGGPKARAAR